MKTKSIVLCLTLAVLSAATEANAQSVPAEVNRLAKRSLSCESPSVYSERIGPAKRGYVATCGDSEIAVYEKGPSDFRKIFQFDMPMRAQWSFGRKSNRGYYNFGWVVLTNSGGACVETYRWNGRAYGKILDKCYDKR